MVAAGGAGRSDTEQVAREGVRMVPSAKAGGGEGARVLAPGRACRRTVTLGGFSCVPMWHFHLSQPEGLACAGRGLTLPGSDQVVAEGASQEGAGNPSAARFPLQIPGNAMASVQEESPQLSLLCTVARAAVQEPPVGVATSHTRGTCVVRPPMGTYKPSVTRVIAHMPCRGCLL